ncbi:DMT family transporter [Periweissella cryptocerci]|uniref:DMT family transporter n=1 Tax=Periweissella cryptocerci TaxID=2506420 RepID=A0A4P6YWL2_9LACO|nr:DMT family transporter [Periweissella cryptocerci]QBO37157.1 DMT family transporter [Periweissella cryptocerci]
MVLALMLVGLIAGVILANQNPVNALLRTFVGSPYRASFISFSVGVVFIGIITLISGATLFPTGAEISGNPAWLWLGGAIAAIYLTSNILLFPKLGAIQTVILPILGQVLMGTVIDTFGLFGDHQIPLTASRVIGVVILLLGMVIAVVLANRTKAEAGFAKVLEGTETASSLTAWRVWGVIAGMLSATQQAINGQLGVVVGSPLKATFISFLISWFVVLLMVLVIDHRPIPTKAEIKGLPWWAWIGGVLGSLFVLLTVILVPRIGAGLTVTTALIGQIGGSVIVALWGMWRSPKAPVKRLQVIGIVVMIIGVLVIKGLI